MKSLPKVRWKSIALIVSCVAVGGGIFIGVSSAAPSDNPSGLANTAGAGGHPYPMNGAGPAVALAGLPALVRSELSTIGATSAVPLASIGGGSDETVVYGTTGSSGASCVEFASAGATIASPPNCASSANLRVWSEESGTGNPDHGDVTSTQVVAVVSTSVATVRVTFADGSTRDYAPDGTGIVMVETTSGQSVPESVSALDAAGTTLATLGV